MRKIFSPRNYIVIICSLTISFAIMAEEQTTSVTLDSNSGDATLKLPTVPDFKQVDFTQTDFLGSGASIKAKKFPSIPSFSGGATGTEFKPNYSFTDMYLNGDGNALGLYRASEVGFTSNFVSRPCRDKNGDVRSELVSLSKSSEQINRAVACNDDVKFSGYDDCSCAQYESCTKAVLGIDNFFGFKLTSHYQNIIQPYIGEALGQRYAEKAIDNELKNIEETKLLRKYAQKIGVEIPDSKQCEDRNLSGQCKPEEIDGIIYNKQKACGISSKINCYNVEDSDYKSIELAEGQKDIKYDLFLEKIAENKAVELMTHELNVGNDIASLFLEKDKKKTTKPSMKLTLSQLKEKLTSINAQKKLDPVLAFVLKDETRLNQFYNKMSEIFKAQKTPTQAFFKDAIAAYRKETLEDLFSDLSCSNKSSLKRICEMKYNLANAKKNKVPLMASSEISNYFRDEDDFDRDFETYKSQSMFKVIDNSNEFASMIKGYRCFMLKYDFNKVKVRKQSTCGTLASAPTSAEESVYAISTKTNSSSTEDNSNGPDGSNVERDNSKINIGSLNIENSKGEEMKTAADQVESAKNLDLNKAMTDTMNNNFGNNLIPDAPIVNNNHNEFNQTVPVTPSDADQKNEKSPAAILEEKLRELTNKIAAAEQSLDKIKSGKKDDDSKAVSGQSNDEMAKTLEAQIKQLRSELAAAKSKAPTIVEKAEPAIARNIASVPTSSISSTRESGDDRRNYANDPVGKRETSRESTRGFGESGTSTTSASTSAAANSIQGSSTQSRVGGLVLTKVDGLSSDAAIETITAKIAEMAGQPFLIEEGGFVKEIIPVVKDGKIVLDSKGKPIFEKIIKGKVADLKHKDSKRAPASVSSQAELRKIEEAKVKTESERLKYKNLRELTDEAVK